MPKYPSESKIREKDKKIPSTFSKLLENLNPFFGTFELFGHFGISAEAFLWVLKNSFIFFRVGKVLSTISRRGIFGEEGVRIY